MSITDSLKKPYPGNPDGTRYHGPDTNGAHACTADFEDPAYKDKQEILHGKMRDTGLRAQYEGGGLREPKEGKGRFDLIPPEMLFRVARWYELGAVKYGDRNWEKGVPVSGCISAAFRHLIKYLAGWHDEDHLAAVIWNCAAIMRFEIHNHNMLDLPWQKEEAENEHQGKRESPSQFACN